MRDFYEFDPHMVPSARIMFLDNVNRLYFRCIDVYYIY